MAGLDKIKEQILAEAEAIAKEKIDAANAEAKAILDAARAEGNTESGEISQRAATEQGIIKERAKSSVQMKERQAVLRAKQELIADTLDKAYDTVLAMDSADYFNMVRKMLKSFALSKDGEIYFSKKDLARIPSGFEVEINDIAKANGGSLKLASDSKNLDGGFILVYGGIEENCSIKSMFSTKKDELADVVCQVLFAGES